VITGELFNRKNIVTSVSIVWSFIFQDAQRSHCYLLHMLFCACCYSQKPYPIAYPIAPQPSNEPDEHLLERNETRRVGSTNTRSSVLDGVAIRSLASADPSDPRK
jgi:hypothetical protein